jgi:hypothetical protein
MIVTIHKTGGGAAVKKNSEPLQGQITIDEYNQYLETLNNKKKWGYRMKTIVSGKHTETEIYPIPATHMGARGKKAKESRTEQKFLNRKNSRKHMTRLIHCNFDRTGIWCTFTYAPGNVPEDDREAQRDIQNYMRRLKNAAKKNCAPGFKLKYIYVTERVTNEQTGKAHAHHHIITNFPDRDKAEALWTKGRTNVRRLQPNDYGFEELGAYMAKEETKEGNRKGMKRFGYSLNLQQPKISISDHRMTKKRVAELTANPDGAREFFEKMYKGYRFIDMDVKTNPYDDGAYIHARMRRKE